MVFSGAGAADASLDQEFSSVSVGFASTRSSSQVSPLFWLGGFNPTKIDYRKNSWYQLILASLLQDPVNQPLNSLPECLDSRDDHFKAHLAGVRGRANEQTRGFLFPGTTHDVRWIFTEGSRIQLHVRICSLVFPSQCGKAKGQT